MNLIRRRYIFTGRVQGVGFRSNARSAANAYNLTGWVKNEWDGTVTVEVQGLEENMDRMLLKLQSHRWIRIDHVTVMNMPLQEENGFRVK